jgi:hypothetical protein
VVPELLSPQEPTVNLPVPTGNPGSPAAPAGMIAEEIPPVPAAEVPTVPVIPLLEDELFEEPPGIPLEDGLFAKHPGISGFGYPVSQENNVTESSPIQKTAVKLAVMPDIHPPQSDPLMGVEEAPVLTRVIPPVPRGREPVTVGNDRTGTRVASPEHPGPPGSPDIISRYEETPENRHLIPADPDILPSVSDEPPFGAGTDVPMTRDRNRSPQTPSSSRSPKNGDLQQPAPGGRPGRVARLIATLFARKKK